MQSFIISHSSCAEQYGDMSSDTQIHSHRHTHNTFFKFNWVTGSPPKSDTLLASWYPTYMQSFIISHSSCAEQYGDMSSDTQTHSHRHTQQTFFNLSGPLGDHQNLTHCWHHGTRHTCKVSYSAIHDAPSNMATCLRTHRLTHTQLNHQRLASN